MALVLVLAGGMATLAAVGPVEGAGPPVPRPLILRDGPASVADVADRGDARAVLAATWAANLAGRYAPPEVRPVSGYRSGDGDRRPVIYASTDPRADVPDALLADVAAGRIDVLWSGPTIRQLHRYLVDHGHQPGWREQGDAGGYDTVSYRRIGLARPDPGQLLVQLAVEDHGTAVLASASTPDGRRTVWALRHQRLTLVAETPLSGEHPDYGTAYADLITGLLDPGAPVAHRALVRIEDISPETDPERLRAVLGVLVERGVPFSLAVIPVNVSPYPSRPGRTVEVTLAQRPRLTAVLQWALQNGGTLVLHGVTHQWRADPNPTSGRTGDDYEFVRATSEPPHGLRYLGPVPEENPAWLAERFDRAGRVMADAGLPVPDLFEFPHYAAAPEAYQAVTGRFGARYERSLYFVDDDQPRFDDGWYLAQAVPYATVDHYGTVVIPENLGFVSGPGVLPVTTPDDLVAGAASLLASSQSTASFFFHPDLDPAGLARVIDGVSALGYRFTDPAEVATDVPAQKGQTNP